MVRGVVGCVGVVEGAQKRATKVASSVSTGMHLAPRNEEIMKSIPKRWRGCEKHTSSNI
jgi:hypothetical protein